jgi:hypothetical protein
MMNQTEKLLRVSVTINLVVVAALAVLVLGCHARTSAGVPTLVETNGLPMRMTGDDAISVAQGVLDASARGAASYGLDASQPRHIISVIASRGAGVGAFEPRAAGVIDSDSKVWVIRAEGPFLQNRGLAKPRVFSSGYIVVDDASGDVLAEGMP